MRVFVAIELAHAVREQLTVLQTKLKPYVQKGNFSRPENFHITVRFLGERNPQEIDSVVRCIQRVAMSHMAFSLESHGLGCFHKKRDICYAAIETTPALLSVYRTLQDELWHERIISQKETYTPHITLAREVVWKEPYTQVFECLKENAIPICVGGLSLMESTRIDGQLCYLPLFYQGFSAKEGINNE